jgi:hypothetical protein
MTALGDAAQPADAVARSVALLMADKQRNGECVYSEKGKYWDVENGENGLHEMLKRMMPGADVEGQLALAEKIAIAEAQAKMKASL